MNSNLTTIFDTTNPQLLFTPAVLIAQAIQLTKLVEIKAKLINSEFKQGKEIKNENRQKEIKENINPYQVRHYPAFL